MNRRSFLKTSSALAASSVLVGTRAWAGKKVSPNSKLNIGVIGVANRAEANLLGVAGENVVAICDVDEKFLNAAGQKFAKAARYSDFRKLLDRTDLDAVVVSTADHTHAVAAAGALRQGLHVYSEKPLTRTVAECRTLRELAAKNKCVTQLGTQIHSLDNYRRVVELIQSGAIGKVSEVHVWVGGALGGKELSAENPPIPAGFDYDLWLGPVKFRPYKPDYHPFQWRNWWAFAGGTLADLGCHHFDLSHWALDLRYPLTIEAEGPPVHPESTPPWLIVKYLYPARGTKPPVNLTWYHGGKRPPQFAEGKLPQWGDGTLFVGEKGMLLADYNRNVLLPQKSFEGYQRPAPYIPKSLGHYEEWILAIKSQGVTTCNFDYSGALTEAVLLGNVAYRAGKKLEWDAAKLRAKNCREADEFIQYEYRKGWKL